jgi:hypothetical protein
MMSGIVDFVLRLVITSYGTQLETEETFQLIESNLLGPGLHTKVYVKRKKGLSKIGLLPPLPPLPPHRRLLVFLV